MLAVAPLLASCGGNDESSSPSTTESASTESTTTSGDAPATTAAPTDGASAEFCAVSDRLDAVFAGELESGTEFTEEQIAIFEEVKAAAPDEISGAVTTVLDGAATRLRGLVGAMADPGTYDLHDRPRRHVLAASVDSEA